MKSARKLISVGLLVLLVCTAATAIAQQEGGGAGGAAEVDTALNELRNTSPTDRAEARQAVQELGNDAVQPLIEEVQGYSPGGDANYVANCIIALGNLGDSAATNALLEALENENQQIAYTAARALGKIHSGSSINDQVREVNGALAATVYREYPHPLALGAAIALSQINGIGQNPTSRNLEGDLYPAVTQWYGQNPDSLPALENQSWPLLLQTAVNAQQQSRRDQATELLVGRKPLEAVNVIFDLLRGERAQVSDERWSELAGMLEDITGVSFPQDGSQQERLDAWTQQWQRNLKTRTGEEFRNYCWRMLDEKITDFKREPTTGTEQEVNTYKEILLSQMDSSDQIPNWASETAADLLREPIEMKQTVQGAMDAIGPDTAAYRKIAELSRVRSVVRKDDGPPVVRMFAPGLVQMARQTENEDVRAMLSTILTLMTGIPVDLSKEGALQEWLQQAAEKYAELQDI
ncbi:MAG: HEAT repeat domain-containing protein [Planctomycetota bacterium]